MTHEGFMVNSIRDKEIEEILKDCDSVFHDQSVPLDSIIDAETFFVFVKGSGLYVEINKVDAMNLADQCFWNAAVSKDNKIIVFG